MPISERLRVNIAPAATGPGSDVHSLADFIARLDISTLPNAILEKASACLLYGLAVAVASTQTEQSRTAARAQGAGLGRSEATRLIDGARVTAEQASFANAVLFHARCQEDAHSAGHFGAVVLPAALATAEKVEASGADLLAAIVAGYETALRIGRDHVVDLSARGFRSTSVYGVFGAAAAAARLQRLDCDRIVHALALAANTAGGLRAFVAAGSGDYAYHAGFAARNGLLAADLGAHGAEGPLDALSGEAGFFAAFGTRERDYAKRITSALGKQFEMERITFKPYPTCQFHRAIVRGLIRLRAQTGTSAVESIEVRMHPAEADFWGVRFTGSFRNFSQAFMSAPFCAAVAWTRGDVRYDDLQTFDDEDVLALVRCVTVISDPQRSRYAPMLTITLADGRRLHSDEAEDDYALTWGNAVAMAHKLTTEAGVPTAAVEQFIQSVEAVAAASNISDLISGASKVIMKGNEP